VAYRPEPAAAAQAQPGAAGNFEATQVTAPGFAATVPSGNPGYAATVPAGGPGFAATVPAGPGQAAFAATMPASALPGYDAGRKDPAAPAAAQYEKTSVMSKPGVPDGPKAGGGKTGQEP
jgi:hypothetical protein